MNEKIKEFYEESSYSRYVKTDGNGNDHYRSVTNYQRFAELIIRECISIVHDKTDDSIKITNAIEKHFGLE